ncbi:hypothetical protein ACFQH9_21960 [Pseudonocardia lutea]|uniref:Uncharacterized protein n=1 Tax=Pseudonocardia lutea TaxID=2172015 RepID=A0ABW1IF05_9PSEU
MFEDLHVELLPERTVMSVPMGYGRGGKKKSGNNIAANVNFQHGLVNQSNQIAAAGSNVNAVQTNVSVINFHPKY